VTTVIIPAHNESQVIGRLLRQLVPPDHSAGPKVIVVANGCTDDTPEVAASFGGVQVLSIPVASKHQALLAGDLAAADLPRLYVDADIELRVADVEALAAALRQPGILATAPERVLDLEGRPWPVRWYYDVWSRLPEVERGLFGRGVIAVDTPGHARLAGMPPLLADDLAAALLFAPHERSIVRDARVVVHTPRSFGDLLRRRIRAVQGVAQIERAGHGPGATARTRAADLIAIAASRPGMLPRVALFVSVAAIARLKAARALARGDFSTWQRDESSRRGADDAAVAVRGSDAGRQA
jgi:glycosyltransferase involved in cell wall biosynthesis